VDHGTIADRVLDRLYLFPRETRSLEDWERTRHLDLAGLSALDLERDAFGVTRRLYRDRDRSRVVWLLERRTAVGAELGRRRDAERRCTTDAAPTETDWQRSPRPTDSRPPLVIRRRDAAVTS